MATVNTCWRDWRGPATTLDRKTLRQFQRYVVNIPRRIHQRLLAEGAIEERRSGVYVQVAPLYDPDIGLRVEQTVNYAPG
ncbi:MAG: hypothetical protein V9H25_09205 [Candidatus Competibacter sp.]